MVSIRHEGRSYSVLFEFSPNQLRLDKHGFENVDTVEVYILDEDQKPVAFGTSIKSERDRPNDYVGMKLALARAVKFTEDRALREKFHRAFQNSLVGELQQQQREHLQQIQQQRRLESGLAVRRISDVRI